MPRPQDSSDPFGFNAGFPDPPPEAKDWQPDPDCIPRPRVIKDARFHRAHGTGPKMITNRHEQMLAGYAENIIDTSSTAQPSYEFRSDQPEFGSYPTKPPKVSEGFAAGTVHEVSKEHGQKAALHQIAQHGLLQSARDQQPKSKVSKSYLPPHLRNKSPLQELTEQDGNFKSYLPPHLRNKSPLQELTEQDGNFKSYLPPHLRNKSPSQELTEQDGRFTAGHAPVENSPPSVKSMSLAASSCPNPGLVIDINNSKDGYDSTTLRTSKSSQTLFNVDQPDVQAAPKHKNRGRSGAQIKVEPNCTCENLLNEDKKDKDKDDAVTSADAYVRSSKLQEILWKRCDLGLPLDNQPAKEALMNLYDDAFEDYHAHICYEHRQWFDRQFKKAKTILQIEREMNVSQVHKDTVNGTLAIMSNQLDDQYTTITTRYKGYMKAKLAVIAAMEKKPEGGVDT